MLRQEMGVGWLNGSITAQTVNNTNLFSLKVTSTSAQDALDILNAVIELYPRVADYVIGSTEMNILTPPVLAAAPYNPFRLARTVCKGVLAGLALGLLIILAYAATRRTIRSPEEIRRLLNQTCVAALPRVAFKRRSGSLDQNISIRNPKVSSSFQESVRSMRIKFLREAEKRESRVVMVTSTLPGEGKTTVAVNLALTLSQNGARVILVDLDLRKPSVKKCLGLQNPSRGVPELLADKGGNVLDSLLPVPGTQVRLLAGDEASTAPRRQMESRRLAVLLGMLRQEADFIVLDTPPCGILADSAALARLADSTLYVVRSGTAQVSHIVDGLQFLAGSATPLMGCVLNGVQADGGGYGYGGYHYGKYSSYAKKEEPV